MEWSRRVAPLQTLACVWPRLLGAPAGALYRKALGTGQGIGLCAQNAADTLHTEVEPVNGLLKPALQICILMVNTNCEERFAACGKTFEMPCYAAIVICRTIYAL